MNLYCPKNGRVQKRFDIGNFVSLEMAQMLHRHGIDVIGVDGRFIQLDSENLGKEGKRA